MAAARAAEVPARSGSPVEDRRARLGRGALEIRGRPRGVDRAARGRPGPGGRSGCPAAPGPWPGHPCRAGRPSRPGEADRPGSGRSAGCTSPPGPFRGRPGSRRRRPARPRAGKSIGCGGLGRDGLGRGRAVGRVGPAPDAAVEGDALRRGRGQVVERAVLRLDGPADLAVDRADDRQLEERAVQRRSRPLAPRDRCPPITVSSAVFDQDVDAGPTARSPPRPRRQSAGRSRRPSPPARRAPVPRPGGPRGRARPARWRTGASDEPAGHLVAVGPGPERDQAPPIRPCCSRSRRRDDAEPPQQIGHEADPTETCPRIGAGGRRTVAGSSSFHHVPGANWSRKRAFRRPAPEDLRPERRRARGPCPRTRCPARGRRRRRVPGRLECSAGQEDPRPGHGQRTAISTARGSSPRAVSIARRSDPGSSATMAIPSSRRWSVGLRSTSAGPGARPGSPETRRPAGAARSSFARGPRRSSASMAKRRGAPRAERSERSASRSARGLLASPRGPRGRP